MTESDYTRKLVKALRQRIPTAVTFKYADMFTMGVPDFSVTLYGITTWYEAKKPNIPDYIKPCPVDDCLLLRPSRDVPAVQWETLRRLNRGYLVMYTARGHALTHVSGLRESVGQMKLQLMSLEKLAIAIIKIAQLCKPKEEE